MLKHGREKLYGMEKLGYFNFLDVFNKDAVTNLNQGFYLNVGIPIGGGPAPNKDESDQEPEQE